MPEKKTTQSFDAIMRELKAGHFLPVYVLMGDESYYIDQISDYIQNHVLKPDQQAFDQIVVYGLDTNASQLTDLAMQYPMTAPVRVIIVKEAQGMKSIEKLEKYVKNPQPKTILVICYKNGTINRRTKFMSGVEKVGLVFESKKLREWQLPGYVQSYLSKRKVAIDEKSANMIAESIGADLSRLHSELDKLLISLPEDNRCVSPEMVERNIGVSKDFNAFELRSAIVNKNVFKANQIIKYFDNNPKAGSVYSFLPLLFNFFQNLMLAYYAPNRVDKQSVANYIELKSLWGVTDYMTGMRNYSGRKTLQILDKIRETDTKSKGLDNPNTSTGDLMKELIFYILH
ncbi:DNA polymerase III subunit delta [Hallella colorans]|uniref:DNA polymerase III delta subunit n=1 Tax=Hallella colorans TaxID=1703337 RepID=A0A2U0UG20_9BACT|nr:DNA polymerase III subunit delta [Hallella colorans]PVX56531.1 DNA polymerase III delta subunit [Hallella colorans]